MRILSEEYPLREDFMILVKNSLSVASSYAFIPTFQLKYLQNRGKHTKSHQEQKQGLFLLDSKGLSIARPWKLDWEKQQIVCMARKKEQKSCSSESRYEDLLFLLLHTLGRNKDLPTQKLVYNPPTVYIHYIFRQSNALIHLLPVYCFCITQRLCRDWISEENSKKNTGGEY